MAKSKDQIKTARKNRSKRLNSDNANLKKSSQWYDTAETKKRFTRKAKINRATKLRPGIEAGQVLILLSGRFRGRRVIFLKQLPSGLLLVTGPYKLNGVPLKRVNQSYVLVTKTNVSLGSIPSLNKISDELFKRVQVKRTEENHVIPADDSEKRQRITDDRKTNQNNVDTEVIRAVKTVPLLRNYLQNRFTLKNGNVPHLMTF